MHSLEIPITHILKKVRKCAKQGRVILTYKAFQEMQFIGLGLDKTDVCRVLESLTSGEYDRRLRSERSGEWMYVFKPTIAGMRTYLKIILRVECVVISFHEEVKGDEKG